jgi:hypothetical protein
MDADVLWPKVLPKDFKLEFGKLYTPLRRMHTDLTKTFIHREEETYNTLSKNGDVQSHTQIKSQSTHIYPPENKWMEYPIHPNVGEWAGYTQIFHAEDPVLGPAPWHEIDWKHAGGADSFFQLKWPSSRKVRPGWEVLHLGEAGRNWCGRATPYIDGTYPVDSQERMKRVRGFIRGRGRGVDRYRGEKLS